MNTPGGSATPAPAAATAPAAAPEGISLSGVLFAFSAAAAYGTSQVITRGSIGLTTPLVGTLIALLWGTLGFTLLSARDLAQRGPNFWRGARLFSLAGLFSAMGVLLLFEALSRGQVVIVSPIAATNALFTMFFASLMLRGVEKITARVVLGAVLVVAGVVVLSVFK